MIMGYPRSCRATVTATSKGIFTLLREGYAYDTWGAVTKADYVEKRTE
jgi:hypothetical protein